MRPGIVVMDDVLSQHMFEVPPAEDDQPVKALTADAPHPALGITIRDRHLDRRANDSHTVGAEDVREVIVAGEPMHDEEIEMVQSGCAHRHPNVTGVVCGSGGGFGNVRDLDPVEAAGAADDAGAQSIPTA